MARRKSPRLKKQDRLDRDHRVLVEWPKHFRVGWPKKKAKRRRRFRHKVAQILTAAPVADADELTSRALAAVPRERLKKYRVKTLRESIAIRREYRQAVAGRKVRAQQS